MRCRELNLTGDKHRRLLDAAIRSLDTGITHSVYIVNVNNALKALLLALTLCFAGVIFLSLRDTSAKEGGKAPQFNITTDNGQHVTPTAFGGKVLVLNFWATWCAPCVQEIPSLNEFQKEFAKNGVVVVAVSIDKNPQRYRNFLDHVRVSFDTVRDPSANISAEYGTFQYPESYIIKDGRVVRKFANAENWLSDDMKQYVKSLL
ncbi:MAG TPA: TlpA disulfide reductase family protein [Bryobacteraceae bacterium]|nr:TlpA disulfide reductase family protein [Bryobacteraceae bacterium]